MDGIREYLIRLTAAALVCGIVTSLVGKKGSIGSVIKLLVGIFMMMTIVSPWMRIRFDSLESYFEDISTHAQVLVDEGENAVRDDLATIIKEKTQAYILDKANSFGAELTVEVSVDGSELPVPNVVRISGSISPYGRKQLESIITQELGIALEDQIWIS